MKRYVAVASLAAIFWLYGTAFAATTDSVSQYGITWKFAKKHLVGTFVNGDYWVLGPVTITSITPSFDGSHHGWEVNPLVSGNQGFDKRITGFSASLVPALPYRASGKKSICKSVSHDNSNDQAQSPFRLRRF